MKIIVKTIIAQVCCLALCNTGAIARDAGGRFGDSRGAPGARSSAGPAGGFSVSQAGRPSLGVPSRSSIMPMSGANRSPSAVSRPVMRPSTLPASRPSVLPSVRPQLSTPRLQVPALRPATKPTLPNSIGSLPSTRSTTRSTLPNRTLANPSTLPGGVSYAKSGQQATLPANVKRSGNNIPGLNTPRPVTLPGQNTKPVTLPGQNTKPVTLPGQNTKPIRNPGLIRPGGGSNNWWGSNGSAKPTGPGNGTHQGPNNINNDFRNNINWSTNRNHWGYNPWWNHQATRPWYRGSWHCNWNNDYYRHNYWCGYPAWPGYGYYGDGYNDLLTSIGWGLAGWGLGNLIYDCGYLTYYNPYITEPVVLSDGGRITYTEPINAIAARSAPAGEDANTMTARSESFVLESQAAFKRCDFLVALESANKAVAAAPGDGALHEYRALVLFALGKYAEAAGVLNPVLAGGPGWNWATMISLYDSQQTYTLQLQSLERYSKAMPQAADVHFLLGYHYMVGTRLGMANAEFTEAARLQPADSVSAQLRDLTKASAVRGAVDRSDTGKEPAAVAPPPAPVPLEKLHGKWLAARGEQGTVTLVLKHDGTFLWIYDNGDKSTEFKGAFSINDNGLLVLDAEQSQMVASVELPQESQLKFVLAGGPPGDPGLTFVKK